MRAPVTLPRALRQRPTALPHRCSAALLYACRLSTHLPSFHTHVGGTGRLFSTDDPPHRQICHRQSRARVDPVLVTFPSSACHGQIRHLRPQARPDPSSVLLVTGLGLAFLPILLFLIFRTDFISN